MGKILVVDDHPDIVRLVQIALQREGHEVLTAGDGEEAMRVLHAERPELILLDVIMPKLDGYRVLNRIRADPELQNIIVIMLTVKTEPEDISLAVHVGADYYITKPFNPTDIVSMVRRSLEAQSAAAAANPPAPPRS